MNGIAGGLILFNPAPPEAVFFIKFHPNAAGVCCAGRGLYISPLHANNSFATKIQQHWRSQL